MKLRVALLCLAIVLLTTAAAAVAGGPGTPVLKGAKKKSGPYSSELRVKVGDERRNVFVRVKSTHDATQTATLTEGRAGQGDPEADYHVDWFRGKKDVSHDMQTSGYEFTLKPNKPKLFRARLRAEANNPEDFCLYTNVQVDEPSTGTIGPLIAVNGPSDVVCVP
jgi:hypothetical protein